MPPKATASAPPQTRNVRLQKLLGTDYRLGWTFVAPIVVMMVVLIVYPFGYAIALSFTQTRVGAEPIFIGFDNYINLADSRIFRQTVYNSFYFTFVAVFFKFVVGLIMALLLNNPRIRGRNILAGILLIPWVTPTIVSVLNWLWMFDFNLGVLNFLLKYYDLSDRGLNWLGNRNYAMFSIILVNVWRGFPFFGVNILAAIKTVPKDLHEAAMIDGANAAQRLWYVTLPYIRKVIFIVVLLSTIWTFNEFLIVWILTGGGPANTTQIFGTLTYDLAFNAQQLGEAVTVSIYIMPFLLLVIFLLTRYLRRDSH